MIKTTCDRCGRDVPQTISVGASGGGYHVQIDEWWVADVSQGNKPLQFCHDCQNDIGKYALKRIKR